MWNDSEFLGEYLPECEKVGPVLGIDERIDVVFSPILAYATILQSHWLPSHKDVQMENFSFRFS